MKYFKHIKSLHWMDSTHLNTGWENLCYDEDIQQSEKYKSKRKEEFLKGRALVYSLMDKLDAPKNRIKTGDRKEPLFKKPFIASISHTKGFVIACANNQSIPIGIDIELKDRITKKLYKKLFNQNEIELLDKGFLPEELFSAKEAFYKMQYPITNTYVDFLDVELKWKGDYFEVIYIKDSLPKVKFTKIYLENLDKKILTLSIIEP